MQPEPYESIIYEVGDGIATIRFNRPKTLNAWMRTMGLEIRHALQRATTDRFVRAIVLTGNGRAFCAGADLSAARPTTPEGDPDLGSALQQIYNPMILAIREAPKPVIAAVNGPAVGYAVSFAAACDLVLAAESAYFMLSFTRIGLSPDGGASLLLPARVGFGRALELALTAERLGARDACAGGLVNAVHPDQELAAATDRLPRRLAAGPVDSFTATKRLYNLALLPTLQAQLGAEAYEQFERGLSAEYAEGVAAFLEKREPNFIGLTPD